MDGRTALLVRSQVTYAPAQRLGRVLASGLLLAVGCTQTTEFVVKPGDIPPGTEIKKAEDGPKRQPKANTCVAFGNLHGQAAADPKCSPSEQEMMRERARQAFLQALKSDPKNVEAQQGLARLYQSMNKHELALESYEAAIKDHPENASLRFDLGMCHARGKDWESALKNLRAAMELDAANRSYANAYGFCLAKAGRYDESYSFFAKRVGKAQAHYNVARILYHHKDEDACKQHLRLAVKLDPNLACARKFLAIVEGYALDPAQSAVAAKEEEQEPGIRSQGSAVRGSVTPDSRPTHVQVKLEEIASEPAPEKKTTAVKPAVALTFEGLEDPLPTSEERLPSHEGMGKGQ